MNRCSIKSLMHFVPRALSEFSINPGGKLETMGPNLRSLPGSTDTVRADAWQQVMFMMVIVITSMISSCLPAHATRLPPGLRTCIKTLYPGAQLRLDGAIKTKEGILLLPLIPAKDKTPKGAPVKVTNKFPAQAPELVLFDNGWSFLQLKEADKVKLLALPAETPPALIQELNKAHLPADLIVPEGMVVEQKLAGVIGDLRLPTVTKSKDAPAKETTTKPEVVDSSPSVGLVAATSPSTGKIVLLGAAFKKVAELPTDGTPGGMAQIGKKLFIADQSKDRILIVDTEKGEFAGQIDLPKGCSPRDVIVHSSGKFLYATESGSNTLAVIELDTKKVLMRTKLPPGPTRMKMTPNGFTILVVCASSSKLAFISTLNQKLVAVEQLGKMPDCLTITKSGKAAYISNRNSDDVAVVDITHHKVVASIKCGEGPTGLALSEDEKMLFVSQAKANSIGVIDLKTRQKAKDVQMPLNIEFPGDLLYLPGGNHLIVSSAATDTIGIFNTQTLSFDSEKNVGYTTVNLLWVPL